MDDFFSFRRGIFALIILLASSGQSVVIRHDRTLEETVTFGAQFNTVCAIDATEGWFGSGTLIAPDWVLTAAHVVRADADNYSQALSVYIDGTSIAADQWFSHPSYDYNDNYSRYDIALVHLSTPVDWISPTPLFSGTLAIGDLVSFAGYGDYGTGLTGAAEYGGYLRGAQNVVDAFGGVDQQLSVGDDTDNLANFASHQFFIDFDAPDQDGPIGGSAIDFEGDSAPGDSGGGWFIEQDGTYYLTGLTTGGFLTNCVYGDLAYNLNTSDFNSWIYESIPEPGTLSLIGLALTGVLLGRRFLTL